MGPQTKLPRKRGSKSQSFPVPSSESAFDLVTRFPSGLPFHRSCKLCGTEVTASSCEPPGAFFSLGLKFSSKHLKNKLRLSLQTSFAARFEAYCIFLATSGYASRI